MITVHGYLGGPSAELCRMAMTCALVVGGGRVLDALGVPAERRVVLGRLQPAIERLSGLPADADALVLASGDPLFFGVVRRLRGAGLRVAVRPAPSSVAAAFAAVAVPWDDAQVVSAHGRDLRPALNACRALPKVAVLTSPGRGVRELARGLQDVPRAYVIAERLGEPDERVRVVDATEAAELDDVAEPNVVLVLADRPDRLPADPEHAGAVTFLGADTAPRPGRSTSAAAACVYAREGMPGLGESVWVEGALGEEVGVLARAGRAAVVDLAHAPIPGHLPPADLAVTDHPDRVAELLRRGGAPVVLATSAAPPDRGAGLAGVTEQVAESGPDGRTLTSYLTRYEPAGAPA